MYIKFNQEKKVWVETEKEDPEGKYIDKFLKQKLDNIKKIINKNWNATILIDGDTRTGKFVLAYTCLRYLSDNTFQLDDIVSGLDEAVEKLDKAKDKGFLLFDEGSLTFSGRDSMRKEQKQLLKILDVCAQKNLTIFVCLPSFFELSRPIATYHSLFLLHVYADENYNRGSYSYYSRNKKKKLFAIGKKNYGSYAYPEPDFVGKFSKLEPPWNDKYLKLKRKSLVEALRKDDKSLSQSEIKKVKDDLIKKFFYNSPLLTAEQVYKGFGIGRSSLYRIINKKENIPSPKEGL